MAPSLLKSVGWALLALLLVVALVAVLRVLWVSAAPAPAPLPPGGVPWYADPNLGVVPPAPGVPAPGAPSPGAPAPGAPVVYEISATADPLLVPGALPAHFFFRQSAQGASPDIRSCYADCQADPGCLTFSYDPAMRSCRLADRYDAGRVDKLAPGRTYGGILRAQPDQAFDASIMGYPKNTTLPGSLDPALMLRSVPRNEAKTMGACFDQCRADVDCTAFAYNDNQKTDTCRLFRATEIAPQKQHGKNYQTYAERIRPAA